MPSPTATRAAAFAAVALLPLCVPAQDPRGTIEEFRRPLSRIAEAVSTLLNARGADSVSVGQFTGPPAFGAAAGSGLQKMLAEELERLNVRVKKVGGALGVSGEYRYVGVGEDSADFKQIRLEVKLTDRSGQVLTDLSDEVPVGPKPQFTPEDGGDNGDDGREKIKIDRGSIAFDTWSSPASAVALLGMTHDFERDFNRQDDGQAGPKDVVDESLDHPTAIAEAGTRLRASPTSPFALEVLVGGRPRPIDIRDGQPFVTLEKGESFRLRLTNGASFDAGVAFTLDGVNSFAFSEVRSNGRPKYSRWVVPRRQPLELAGWHVDNTKVREFKVTDFSQSAAALAGSENNLGAITVVVAATWEMGQDPPPGEPIEVGAQAPAPGSGIGFGDEAEQRVEEDRQKRNFGRVRAVLTVRYEKPEASPAE